MERHVRVWLEPGYDHGRFGAWLLDWPGAFAWGGTRQAALARVPSAANRFVDWLAEHGEPRPAVPVDVEIVEEVGACRLDDGYEVNPTFVADERAVTSADMEAQIRRLGHARADMVELVDRVKEFEAAHGELTRERRASDSIADGAAEGRDVETVLRHVAGAETWFVSRLEAESRYAGPRDDIGSYLAASREFLVDGLRRIQARDATTTRTDGKGERWTLFKVLRRALYHSLDHLEELDRRLAVAERRVDRVELRNDDAPRPAELRALFAAAGLDRRARDSDELTARMVAGATATVSAWDAERLVGFGRIISDEATNCYVSTVAVAPRWQDRGLGTRLMNALMDGRESLKLTLDAREGTETFYERLGFRPAVTVLVRPRGQAPARAAGDQEEV